MIQSSPRLKSIVALLFTLVLLVCSWVGMSIYMPESNAPFNLPEKLLRTVKAVMGNDPAGASFPSRELPWQLVVAKVLATGVLLVGLFKVVEQFFFEHYTQLRLLFKRQPTLIVGMHGKGKLLLDDLKKNYGETAVVIEHKRDHPDIRQVRRRGHLAVFGNAADAETLKDAGIGKASRLISFLSDEQLSIAIMQTLHANLRHKRLGDPLDCYLHLGNARVTQLVQQSTLFHPEAESGLRLHFFNLHHMLSRQFFHQFVRTYATELAAGKTSFCLIFLGWDELSRALVFQALQVLHLHPAGGIRLLVGAADPERAEQDFLQTYPGAANILPLHFLPYRGNHRAFLDMHVLNQDPTCIQLLVLGAEQNGGGLAAALDILHATPAQDFVLYTRNETGKGLSALLQLRQETHPRLRFYGSLASVCTMEMITLTTQDCLARTMHEDYLAQLRASSASESSVYQTSWEALPEDAKDANRAQADHLPFKLAQLGCLDALDHPQEISLPADAIEALAQSEHERWVAQRLLAGWSYGPTRDNLCRLHPSIVPWRQLSEPEQQKDRDTILRIPMLLQTLANRQNCS